jgi:hypothetical protein
MTIDKMIEAANKRLEADYNTGWGSDDIFERFASEELKLTGFAITRFVYKALYDNGEKDAYDHRRFYTWYYINYCVIEKPEID